MNTNIEETIRHGPKSDMVMMTLQGEGETAPLMEQAEKLAQERDYSKIHVRVDEEESDAFLSAGYTMEAVVRRLGEEDSDLYFLSKFLDPQRMVERDSRDLARKLEISRIKAGQVPELELPDGFEIMTCQMNDAKALASLYEQVSEVGSSRLAKPEYLKKRMLDGVATVAIVDQNQRVVSAASARIELGNGVVELIDFATLDKFRQKGFATALLMKLEEISRNLGVRTSFSRATADSLGMNLTLSKSGYFYGGRLRNNAWIESKLRSQNVWYKSL